MKYRDNLAGQWVDACDHNDNAPFRYSAPSAIFKELLASLAHPGCKNCSGAGYLSRFKHVCSGRCFQCISDSVWSQIKRGINTARQCNEEMAEIYLSICDNGGAGPAYLCDGMWITAGGGLNDVTDDANPSRGCGSCDQLANHTG